MGAVKGAGREWLEGRECERGSHRICSTPGVAKVADLSDAVYPHLQFFLGLGHQIECMKSSLNNEHKIILKFLPNEARAHMLPHCTLAEVYPTNGLA